MHATNSGSQFFFVVTLLVKAIMRFQYHLWVHQCKTKLTL